MFKYIWEKYLSNTYKVHLQKKVNLWAVPAANYIVTKIDNTLIWFKTTYDKLGLNKIYNLNKKWEWDYIVRRTWVILILYVTWLIWFIFIC